jgi:Uncharacterised protein family (UPF0158)
VTGEERSEEDSSGPRRQVPISWEALEDAFENNAPEVHSYLHLATGEVMRVVDGVADPVTHARIVGDSNYRRVEPVSSREQYRWMERFIATVEEGPLRQRLLQSIDGKGAFRRFKDVLMSFPVDRERWFAFRSERLRMCMEGWLDAQGIEAVERPEWQVPTAADVKAVLPEVVVETRIERPAKKVRSAVEGSRARARELIEAVPARHLETVCSFLSFLIERRAGNAALEHEHEHDQTSDELDRSHDSTFGDDA